MDPAFHQLPLSSSFCPFYTYFFYLRFGVLKCLFFKCLSSSNPSFFYFYILVTVSRFTSFLLLLHADVVNSTPLVALQCLYSFLLENGVQTRPLKCSWNLVILNALLRFRDSCAHDN